jgi:hypothetical protein
LDGIFEARNPLANYPLVSARAGSKRIVAAYGDVVVTVNSREATDEIDILNAKASERIIIDPLVPLGRYRYDVVDARGRSFGEGGFVLLEDHPVGFDVPRSGMIRLIKVEED